MANETQRCFIQKPCQRPTARLNWIVLYLSFLSTWKKKKRQLVIRTVTLTNTTEDGKLFLCYAHKHREKKKISQCWLTKMPCNIDDENKASHNKLQSYWDDFLFNNESPSASRVNTASVFCVCQHACVSEEKRGREKKKHLSSTRTKLLYLICTENKQACKVKNKTGIASWGFLWHANHIRTNQLLWAYPPHLCDWQDF